MNCARRPVVAAIRDHRLTWLAAGVLAAGLALSSNTARAESNFQTGAGALTATARLNFQVVIPRFLFLQVGTGTAFGTNAAIDTILFNMTPSVSSIGNGVVQAGTGGDVGAGVVTARVLGNGFAAAANLVATATAGGLSNGAGGTISWTEMTVATAAATVVPPAASTLAHPGTPAAPFANSGTTSVSLTPASGVINQAAQWTFTYKNATVPASGTYNGQVSYTIAMP